MKTYKTQNEVEEDVVAGELKIESDVTFSCEIKLPDVSLRITGDINAENITVEDIDAWDINAENITAGDIKAGDINAENITARDIDARDITAKNITAGDITAKNITAENIDAENITHLLGWEIH